MQITKRRLDELRPSPENDTLYRPVHPTDPEIVALAESIRQHGLREPIVVTEDNWLVSGHRRHCAATLAGLTSVPCRVEPLRRADDCDAFVRLLREYNRQRDKTADEKLREELVTINRLKRINRSSTIGANKPGWPRRRCGSSAKHDAARSPTPNSRCSTPFWRFWKSGGRTGRCQIGRSTTRC